MYPQPEQKRHWQIKINWAGFISGTIATLTLSFPALAQITPDDTLGTERSTIQTTNVNDRSADLIEGGARRGANLFHSFSDFNIGEGQQAYFANPDGVERILSRVTGKNRSNILGTLGVLGNADLFLINPNGILFGRNARLDVRGSFIASSAAAIEFPDGFSFSTTNPEAPPLLTVDVPIGLQMGQFPGQITNQAVDVLQVPTGRTLAWIGGEIDLEGGTLRARSGHLELGAVGSNTRVGLFPTERGYGFDYRAAQRFGNVRLRAGAIASVSGDGAGSLQVQGRNISVTEGAALFATTQGATSGDRVDLNATNSITLSGTTPDGEAGGVFARTTGTGNAATTTVTARRLIIEEGAKISTATLDEGDAGDLTVNASEQVDIIGTLGNGENPSALFADSEGTGNPGTITINTTRFRVRQGGTIGVATVDLGSGGAIIINAAESVELSGFANTPSSTLPSSLNAFTLGEGNAGDITINTQRLTVRNAGDIFAATFGAGRGGDVTVNASQSVEVAGSPTGVSPSRITTQTDQDATGRAGNLRITTERLSVRQGGRVAASSFGRGQAGDLTIRASEQVELIEPSPDRQSASLISSQTEGLGNAGSIEITTGHLIARDGGQVGVSTFGAGNGGRLTINASEIDLVGVLNREATSGLFSQVNSEATGRGGEIRINTDRLTIQEGAQVSAGTRGRGDSGRVTIHATDAIQVTGRSTRTPALSQIVTQSSGDRPPVGDAGTLTLTTPQLIVQDSAQVSVSSPSGRAGSLDITANQLLLNQGRLTAVAGAGNGGNINLSNLDVLLLQNSSLISAQALNRANGGNITIDAEGGFIVATPLENNDIIASAEQGNGGQINITAQSILGLEPRTPLTDLSDINASSEFGIDGTINIQELDVDPAQGTVALPTAFAAPPLAQDCQAQSREGNRFVNTRRGGLPTNPSDPLNTPFIWQDLGDVDIDNSQVPDTTEVITSSASPAPIVEAQGWVVQPNGEIALIALVSPEQPAGVGVGASDQFPGRVDDRCLPQSL